MLLGVYLRIKKIVVFLLGAPLARASRAQDDLGAGDAARLDLVLEDVVLAVEIGESWPESVALLFCCFHAWG